MIRSKANPDGVWRQAIRELSDANLAHSPEWLSVIRNAYGHEPLYLSAEDGEGRPGLLPAFIVRRPFFGPVVTSMPFLDSGGPCSASAALSMKLVERLLCEARRVGAAAVDLRCTQRLNLGVEPMEHKVNMVLSLPDDPDRLWPLLDSAVRNQIRKAERSGLSVEFGGADELDDFYAIFASRMRDLGSPVHARTFFTAMFDAFGSRARVTLVRKGTTPIGGLIALTFKDAVVVPWASCLKQYFALCPNMLMYWETIRTECANGIRRFDFGRSSRGSGTYRFKRQWGAADTPLFWYTIPLRPSRSRALPTAGSGTNLLVDVWQRLPLAVTRQLGPRVRKYLIQ
jgi:FemAB-related protein (PEP-CTERM system-associated)